MKKYFKKARLYDKGVFVADYTQATHSRKGVVIATKEFEDIASFYLENENEIPFWSINFEEHEAFFRNIEGQLISNCECMFLPKQKKGWVCLLELKYCYEYNIFRNQNKASSQLDTTLAALWCKGVLKREDVSKVYLNVAMPEYPQREPFVSFRRTQHQTLMDAYNKVIRLGNNHLAILDQENIRAVRKKI